MPKIIGNLFISSENGLTGSDFYFGTDNFTIDY